MFFLVFFCLFRTKQMLQCLYPSLFILRFLQSFLFGHDSFVSPLKVSLFFFLKSKVQRFLTYILTSLGNRKLIAIEFIQCIQVMCSRMVCVGIFEQSMGARNRVQIGLSYRPAMIHTVDGRYRLIPQNRFLCPLKVLKYRLCTLLGQFCT